MKIAIDYDLTYDQDPECWDKVICILEAAGHKVYMVTGRGESNKPPVTHIPVIVCSEQAKVKACIEAGVEIDVWIDDDPFNVHYPISKRWELLPIRGYVDA